MARLPEFATLDSKNSFFDYTDYNIINTKEEFDHWFNRFNSDNKHGPREDYIYRGMKEAKHKLFTSSQRQWITNDMEEWYPKPYLRYVQDLVERSKSKPLIKKVFDVYDYTPLERDVPVLSILQHYGAPTPLMDWTYNINVALFFATENVKGGNGNGDIENYFSIYFVNKTKHKGIFQNLNKLTGKKHPSMKGIIEAIDKDPHDKSAYYITDFEGTRKSPERKFMVNSSKPLTSIFNQNIIAQEGLLF
ncbi:FRG domain-containing protein [Pontibacter pudoricolor]|uniref:FRG domain-containing protein n=1 Tax=Pontibacter pudoricolor TaxID=2694930 RepID=UPI0013917CEC|nr:FRG domain-containing protein [Pontibacter pudoricolor]